MDNIGFRILKRTAKVDKKWIDLYQHVVTPHVSDNMNRMFAGGTLLKPYYSTKRKMVGAALTIKTRPGDNLLVHKAIDIAEEDDILVVDAGGDTTNAIVGEIMLELSKKKGIKGFVINGAIRDSGAFITGDFPVFAKGVTHRGPYKDGPGEINVPVSIDGMVINPGDLVLGDEDGVVSVPLDMVSMIFQKVKKQAQAERRTFKEIEDGTIDRSWVDQTLRDKGCELK